MTREILTLSRMTRAAPTQFVLEPDAEARARLTADLDLVGLRKLRLEGSLKPEGRADWRLDARLGATAVQSCVVTLEPVSTRIDTTVERSYRADLPEPAGEEMQMPQDDTVEPLPVTLDLNALLAEALALALPDYPRADGVTFGTAAFAAPGVKPMSDEEARPLAGLAAMRDRLAGSGDGTGEDRAGNAEPDPEDNPAEDRGKKG